MRFTPTPARPSTSTSASIDSARAAEPEDGLPTAEDVRGLQALADIPSGRPGLRRCRGRWLDAGRGRRLRLSGRGRGSVRGCDPVPVPRRSRHPGPTAPSRHGHRSARLRLPLGLLLRVRQSRRQRASKPRRSGLPLRGAAESRRRDRDPCRLRGSRLQLPPRRLRLHRDRLAAGRLPARLLLRELLLP
jgi:hypothetical protein